MTGPVPGAMIGAGPAAPRAARRGRAPRTTSPSRALAVALAALAAAAVALAAACGASDEHLERARKQMASGQWANARTALGQVLKRAPRDPAARALLLYCIEREDGLAQVTGVSMYSLYQLAAKSEAPSFAAVPQELRAFLEQLGVEARQALFDRGIDTQDARDLAAVISGAARYGYDHDDDPERRETAAAILAIGGERPAIEHLVGRLKSATPERVVEALVDVGAPAIPGLRAAAADRGFIGRRAALAALGRALASERARALVADHPERKDPRGGASRAAGRDRLERSALASGRDPDVMRVHGQHVPLDDGAEDGLVLLQTWDDRRGAAIVELHAVRGGALAPLRVATRDGAPVELGGGSLAFELAAARGAITLRRMSERTFDAEIETGRVARPAPGMRVRLVGYEPHGAIVREDDGLWIVKVDRPIQGMTELPVAAASLIGLELERRTEVSLETITGKLRGDAFEVSSRDVAKEPLTGGGLPSPCQAHQLLVERLQRCDRLPSPARGRIAARHEQLVEGWQAAPPDRRAALGESCRQSLDSLRQTAASICGL